jgi:hypothetical protein
MHGHRSAAGAHGQRARVTGLQETADTREERADLGRPAKYSCRAGSKGPNDNFPSLKANVQIAVNCAKGPAGLGGFGGAPYFNWVFVSTR